MEKFDEILNKIGNNKTLTNKFKNLKNEKEAYQLMKSLDKTLTEEEFEKRFSIPMKILENTYNKENYKKLNSENNLLKNISGGKMSKHYKKAIAAGLSALSFGSTGLHPEALNISETFSKTKSRVVNKYNSLSNKEKKILKYGGTAATAAAILGTTLLLLAKKPGDGSGNTVEVTLAPDHKTASIPDNKKIPVNDPYNPQKKKLETIGEIANKIKKSSNNWYENESELNKFVNTNHTFLNATVANSCYVNAALQCFFHNEDSVKYILSFGSKLEQENNSTKVKKHNTLWNLYKLALLLYEESNTNLSENKKKEIAKKKVQYKYKLIETMKNKTIYDQDSTATLLHNIYDDIRESLIDSTTKKLPDDLDEKFNFGIKENIDKLQKFVLIINLDETNTTVTNLIKKSFSYEDTSLQYKQIYRAIKNSFTPIIDDIKDFGKFKKLINDDKNHILVASNDLYSETWKKLEARLTKKDFTEEEKNVMEFAKAMAAEIDEFNNKNIDKSKIVGFEQIKNRYNEFLEKLKNDNKKRYEKFENSKERKYFEISLPKLIDEFNNNNRSICIHPKNSFIIEIADSSFYNYDDGNFIDLEEEIKINDKIYELYCITKYKDNHYTNYLKLNGKWLIKDDTFENKNMECSFQEIKNIASSYSKQISTLSYRLKK